MSYFLYVYSPSDFVNPPPNESGGAASGTAPFTLELNPGATPTIIEITDDEAVFDEVDGSQSLTNSINLDGTSYSAGTSIHSAYDLINTATGHKITSMHFGGDGYEQGAIHGIASTIELVPGAEYTFDTERTSYTQDNQYSDYFACFAKGSLIETAQGHVAIENLQVGDMVKTQDHGLQPIRWIAGRTVPATGNMAPIVFSKGAIGNTDVLEVSPEHRMLLSDWRTEVLFSHEQVLIAAKHLVDGDRIHRRVGGSVTYYHFMFDEHEIVFSQGVPSESFFPGKAAMQGLDCQSRDEILALFPELMQQDHQYKAAALCLKSFEATLLG
jgi:hypothetical protein